MAKGSKKKGARGAKTAPRESTAGAEAPAHDAPNRSSRRHKRRSKTSTAGAHIDRVAGIYISAVAFLTGASVMIVELAASRVLSPYFGNTLYTWTALLGVIMIALAGGYYFGGRLADKRPRPAVLLHLVVGAAMTILLIPALSPSVTSSLAPPGEHVDLLWGPLSAALLLFAVPGCLLGSVTPFAVKLLSLRSENERVGTSAGTVSGLSTLGSVLGTFGAGFVLIPSFGIRTIFIVVGGVLLVVAALGYVGLLGTRHRSIPAAALTLIGGLMLSVVAESAEERPSRDTVHQADTYYHRIQVKRQVAYGEKRINTIYMDQAPEGAQYEDSGELVFTYTRFYRLEKIFAPQMRRALFLGGGAYSMPQALVDDHPDMVVEVVEIDPEVERVGRRFFRLDQYEGHVVPIIGDGRATLAASTERYDLIFGDAYRGRQNVPAHMVTREFFSLVRSRLTENGVYMMNAIGALVGSRSRFFRSVAATLLEVFPELYVFATQQGRPDFTQNLILVAPNQRLDLDDDELRERAGDDEQLLRMLETHVPPEDIDTSGATVLTDDYNPVEYIIARQLAESPYL